MVMRRRKARRRKTRRRKTRRKKPAFGGYKIQPDTNFARIVGKKAVTPSQMTKKVWQYIKRKRLAKKGRRR